MTVKPASLVCVANSRLARATQLGSVSKTKDESNSYYCNMAYIFVSFPVAMIKCSMTKLI